MEGGKGGGKAVGWATAGWRARSKGGVGGGRGKGGRMGGGRGGMCVWRKHQWLPAVPVQRERRVRLRVWLDVPLWLEEGSLDARCRCLDEREERLQPLYPSGAAIHRAASMCARGSSGRRVRGWA